MTFGPLKIQGQVSAHALQRQHMTGRLMTEHGQLRMLYYNINERNIFMKTIIMNPISTFRTYASTNRNT